jgi:predicted ATPase
LLDRRVTFRVKNQKATFACEGQDEQWRSYQVLGACPRRCRTAVEGTTSLTAKSLIQTEGAGRLRYRLLDTTRTYALEKLEASGGMQAVASRHTKYYRDLVERAEDEEETLPAAEWLAHYGWHIDNVRAALDWAFSPRGDSAAGIALTAAAIPLWMHLSLPAERGR